MSALTDLPKAMRAAVTREFQGERIYWAGMPNAAKAFLWATPIWLFAIPWTAFAVFWEWVCLGGWLSGKPPPNAWDALFAVAFPLVGMLVLLAGLGMMAAPLMAWRRARGTVHVVADTRLVTMTLGRRLRIKSYPVQTITRMERTEGQKGAGTLRVVMGTHHDSEGGTVEETEVLYGIPRVRQVERVIAGRIDAVRNAA